MLGADMTVIAWDGKTLASDSQMTDDCGITSCSKIFTLSNGSLFGGAGMAGYVSLVRDWLLSGAPSKSRPDCAKYEGAWFGGIIIRGGECYALDAFLSAIRITAPHYAVGSGAAQANALMAAGFTAEKAVAFVIQNNLADGVGGEVQTLQLRKRRKKGKSKS